MNWLNELEAEHVLYHVAEECKELIAESYYIVISEQKDGIAAE